MPCPFTDCLWCGAENKDAKFCRVESQHCVLAPLLNGVLTKMMSLRLQGQQLRNYDRRAEVVAADQALLLLVNKLLMLIYTFPHATVPWPRHLAPW